MNPLDNSSAPPTIRHGVLYTVFHAGGGEDAQEFFPLAKRIKNISKQYSFTSHLFFLEREREMCLFATPPLILEETDKHLIFNLYVPGSASQYS